MKLLLTLFTAMMLFVGVCQAGPDWIDSANDSTTAVRRDSIAIRLAMTLGTPAGLNLNFSGWTKSRLAIRFSGGGFPGAQGDAMAGFQTEIGYKLAEGRTSVFDVSVGGGISQFSWAKKTYLWQYGGIFATANSNDFILQFGITVGTGDFKNPQFSLQLGLNLLTRRRS